MAKQSKPVPITADEKKVIQSTDREVVTFTQSFPADLYSKVYAFKKSIGVSTDQEAVRIICTVFLSKNGF